MNNIMQKKAYSFAVFISSFSAIFGLAREFLIVSLLGFSASNDKLQIYLSIFYSISLSIDAIRLAGLNLFGKMSLVRILLCATLVSLPFTVVVGYLTSYFAGGLDPRFIWVAVIGSFLNLITALLITYKQRYGAFLAAQIINVLPNFVLIPGILLAYWFAKLHIVAAMIMLCCLIPVVQLLLLVFVRIKQPYTVENKFTLFAGMFIFMRHGISMLGEQLFQLTTRALFYKFNAGYLSMLAILVRIYAAGRFILVDSYIGSKLANWQQVVNESKWNVKKFLDANFLNAVLVFLPLLIIFGHATGLVYFAVQLSIILIVSFYLNTLLRIIYFKINREQHDKNLVLRYGSYELIFAVVGYFALRDLSFPLMLFLWIWYVVKPFVQLKLLRPQSTLVGEVLRKF